MKAYSKHLLILVLLLSVTKLFAATTYYVSTTGSDLPERGTSENTSWLTLSYAISQIAADQGNTIQIGAGTYLFTNTLNVPTGINITGAGADLTILKAATAFEFPQPGYNFDHVLIKLQNGNNTMNQVLSDFRIDGNNKSLWGGIYVRDRNLVEIKNVKLYGTYYTGIWFWGVSNCSIHDAYFENCAWGSSGYQSGCINMGNILSSDFYNITIREGLTGSPSTYGYGIKCLGPSSSDNFLTNVRLFNSDIDVNNLGLWNGGLAPNMSAEWHKIKLLNCEIYNNIICDNLSLVNDEPSRANLANEVSVRVHDNRFMLTGGYAIELTQKNCEIDHNFFNGQPYPITTWDKVNTSSSGWKIHHNVFMDNLYQLVRAEYGMSGIDFYNNSIYNKATNLDQIILMVRNSCGNFNIDNNAISYSGLRIPTLVDVSNTATTSNVSASNNCMYGVVRGNHVDNYTGNLENTNPDFTLNGVLPSPFFTLNPTSPCINTGKTLNFSVPDGLPDIGAFESGGIPTTAPVVQFESPVSDQILTPGPVTLKINVTSSAGEIAKVEFYNESKIGEVGLPPFQFTTPVLSAGNYNYKARATDIYGNISSFANVSFKVQNSDGNMIVNGEFDLGLTAWQLSDYTGPNYTAGTNSVSVIQNGGLSGANAAQVNITSTDNQNWTIQLSQQPTTFNLVKGHIYEISFQAKAASDRTMTAAIRGNTTNTDFFNQTVSLTATGTSFGPYTYTCNDDKVSNESGFAFSFYMAKGILSDVFLDKVFVRDITFPNASIETPNPSQGIEIFPNPVSNVLNVKMPDRSGSLRIQIYNLNGQLLRENLMVEQSGQTQVDVEGLPNGIYLLVVKGNNGTQTKKFIVNR